MNIKIPTISFFLSKELQGYGKKKKVPMYNRLLVVAQFSNKP